MPGLLSGHGGILIPGQDIKTISAILCAYTEDRWGLLKEAVRSIRAQTSPPDEIILVIDHNPALFARSKSEFPDLIVAENAFSQGLSGARNTGIGLASGEIVAFMDEDAAADPGWLAELMPAYQDPSVLGAGGAILPAWGEPPPGWFPGEFLWVVGCTYRGLPEGTHPIRNLIGCNMSFRKEVFEQAGGFREGMGRIGLIPVGCEETELCIRANRNDPRGAFLYVPASTVRHHVPANRMTFRYFSQRCYSEGLSKALVAKYVGASRGLSSERAYTFRVLPHGIAAGLRDAFLHREPAGVGRSAAILWGLALTTAGYLAGKIAGLTRPGENSKSDRPEVLFPQRLKDRTGEKY